MQFAKGKILRVEKRNNFINTFKCPQCGCENTMVAKECRNCGVIFTKYYEFMKTTFRVTKEKEKKIASRNRSQALFLVLVLVLLFGLIIVYSYKPKLSKSVEVARKIQPAVVTIITYDMEKRGLRQGSGFFIDRSGVLVTNYHVLENAYSAYVKTYDGKKFPISSIVAENRRLDLVKAAVEIRDGGVSFIKKIAKHEPVIAEQVLVFGSPMGLEKTVTTGIVSGVRQISEIGKVYQITAPISLGSSGSPVVNLEGEVIGIASFRLVEGQNLNFAIPAKYILRVTEEVGKTVADWSYEESYSSEFEDIADVDQNVSESKKRLFYEKLNTEFPGWETMLRDPLFRRWIMQKGRYNIVRQEYLNYYFSNFDADNVIELFERFKKWKAIRDEWEKKKDEALAY